MSEFFVGQKVVCVDDGLNRHGTPVPLTKGEIYTITETKIDNDGDLAVNVAGVLPPRRYGFRASRFRPLEETSKTIEQFREIARGVSNGKPIIEDSEYRMPTPEKVKA